jgi:hypothetical protein
LDIRYGEGPKAFRRWREELIERSTDDSILAWDQNQTSAFYVINQVVQLLAPSPDYFALAQNIVTSREATQLRRMTNVGLQTMARIMEDRFMILNCRYLDDPTACVGLHMAATVHSEREQKIYSILARGSVNRLTGEHQPSRLIPVNVVKAARSGVLHDIIIARGESGGTERLSNPYQNLLQYTVWLRLENQLDHNDFFLDSSVPAAQCPHGNIIWPVKVERAAVLNDRAPVISMVIRYSFDGCIALQLKIWWKADPKLISSQN